MVPFFIEDEERLGAYAHALLRALAMAALAKGMIVTAKYKYRTYRTPYIPTIDIMYG